MGSPHAELLVLYKHKLSVFVLATAAIAIAASYLALRKTVYLFICGMWQTTCMSMCAYL